MKSLVIIIWDLMCPLQRGEGCPLIRGSTVVLWYLLITVYISYVYS